MNKKKFLTIVILIITSICLVIIYFVLYNKTYHININPDHVYEIQIKISYPYQEITLSEPEYIKTYLETVQKLQFTHPHIFTGKGWTTAVTIKMRNRDDIKTEYSYTLAGDYISTGSFRYIIITGR